MSDSRRSKMGGGENWKKPSELQYGEHVIAIKKELPKNQSSYPYYYFVADNIQTEWNATIRFYREAGIYASYSFRLAVPSKNKSGDYLCPSAFTTERSDTGGTPVNLWSDMLANAWVTDGDYGYVYFDSLQSALTAGYGESATLYPWYVDTNTVYGYQKQDSSTIIDPSVADNLHIWFLTE